MNATTLAPGSAAAVAAENLKEFMRESVQRFSNLCQEFFDRERREMLEKEPSIQDLEAHRTAIKWLCQVVVAFRAGDVDDDIGSGFPGLQRGQ